MNRKNIILVGTSSVFYSVVDELINENQINLVHWFFKNPSFEDEIELALKENYSSIKDKTYFKVLSKLYFILNKLREYRL